MCGIAGYAGHGSVEALHRMGDAIKRRGPDDSGHYEAPGIGFAFRRLSIIDVEGGHQPMSNADASVWVMLNGEIYGFEKLRDELTRSGYRFATRSDTEVIVHAYEEWGEDCFRHLNGMFAIAIWDARQARLLLARDRMGKKPLYWAERNGTLWFCSELKGLLAAKVISHDIDPISLGAYFRTDSVPTPRTIFEGVQKVEPASALVWQGGKVAKTWSFWKCPQPQNFDPSPKAVLQELRLRIDRSVHERLVSDVPLGLFLSGGLDSAVVAESAARQSLKPLQAFTIGFEEASHDERPAARRVAKTLGLELHEDVLTQKDALGMLDEAVNLLDEPLADPSILPQLWLAKFTRKSVTVALSGDGGDELLLGYQHVPAHLLADKLAALPMSARRALASVLGSVPSGSGYFSPGFKAQRFARGLLASDPWSRDLAWRGSFTADTLGSLMVPELAEKMVPGMADQDLARRAAEAGSDAPFWKSWTWAYLRTYLLDDILVKVDRATMWYALESRAPLLDPQVVEFLLQVPADLKLGSWKGKRLFKELLRDRLPNDILNRPKHGFAIPTAAWLRGPLAERLRSVSDPVFLAKQGIFRPESVQRLISEHNRGWTDRRKELWSLLMFQLWHQKWV